MKEYRYEINGKNFRVRIREIYGDHAVVEVNDQTYQVDLKGGALTPAISSPPTNAPTAPAASSAAAPAAPTASRAAGTPGAIKAPMPGVIIKVLVDVGDMVNAGDKVMVIEAMKMENEIKSPRSGTVKKILIDQGDSVNTGDELMIVDG